MVLFLKAPLEGGRGKKGGLSAYAEKVGKAGSTVTKLLKAARVAENIGNISTVLTDKVFHLAAIHVLPKSVWTAAVDAMVAKGWSAKETGERFGDREELQSLNLLGQEVFGEPDGGCWGMTELAVTDQTSDLSIIPEVQEAAVAVVSAKAAKAMAIKQKNWGAVEKASVIILEQQRIIAREYERMFKQGKTTSASTGRSCSAEDWCKSLGACRGECC